MYESGKLNGNNNVLIAGGIVVNNEEALEGRYSTHSFRKTDTTPSALRT